MKTSTTSRAKKARTLKTGPNAASKAKVLTDAAAIPVRKKIVRDGATRPWQTGAASEPVSPVTAPAPTSKSHPYLPTVAKAISAFGRIYNGFEIQGGEKIPQKGPALIVFYHGVVPLDAWYFGLQFYLSRGRLVRAMVDRWLFKVPGLKQLAHTIGATEGRPGAAVDLLGRGHLVGVSPGGVREAISGTKNNYKLVWQDRVGFARVALEAKVDIIPVFSENVDELYRAPLADRPFFKNLYEMTRLPLTPILGLGILPFPVKIRTWVGDPIPYDANDTPETLAAKAHAALETLIGQHQRRDQSVVEAIVKRFT